MIVLGFNCYGHDSAAALMIDGEVVFAVEEERLNRQKHFGGLPEQAIRACLDYGNMTMADVDHVTFFWKPSISYSRVPVFFFRYLDKVPSLWRESKEFTVEENLGMIHYLKDMRNLRKTLIRLFPTPQPPKFRVHLLEHHLCHAASAFYPSGYDEAAIMTLDGAGEWTTALLAHGKGNQLNKLTTVDTPYSLGAFYQAVSRYLGFKLISGPGKLMGLASYGDKNAAEYAQMRKLFTFTSNGGFKLNMKYFSYHYTRKSGVSPRFHELFGPPVAEPGQWTDHQLNVAAAAQHLVEDVYFHMAEHLKKVTSTNHLCIAGGVGLNSVANGLLTKSGLFDHIFIQPAAGDSGTALGSTLLLNQHVLDRPRKYVIKDAFLGPGYEDDAYEAELKKAGIPYIKTQRHAEFAANKLSEGKILGWHQGRLEFGPRALGNRSIIANPMLESMKDVLNARVKFREGFRPFAAIVLEEDCGEYFDCDYPSPYMLKVYEVRDHWRNKLPSITHSDNTVRIQTVNQTENPAMRGLLEAFKKETGCSCLINTSFNIKGEPIVCSPFDAVDSFVRADMDYLVMGSFVAAKPGDDAALHDWT